MKIKSAQPVNIDDSQLAVILLNRVNDAVVDFRKYINFNGLNDDQLNEYIGSLLDIVLATQERLSAIGILSKDELMSSAERFTELASQRVRNQIERLEKTLAMVDSRIDEIQTGRDQIARENERLRGRIERLKK